MRQAGLDLFSGIFFVARNPVNKSPRDRALRLDPDRVKGPQAKAPRQAAGLQPRQRHPTSLPVTPPQSSRRSQVAGRRSQDMYEFYDALAIYIAAGEAKLAALDNNDIPAKEAEVAAAPEADQVIRAQELRDLRAARDDLERRVHDLKLTRQVTMQSLPSIRLVQENDKSLVTKINSTLVNTVPLWETQLAQAVTIQRSTEAAEAVRAANDLTNKLLEKNASNLRTSNRMIREEMERGVFDIEAVKRANTELVATIEDSLAIADEGRMRRAKAEEDMIKMEAELRDTLAAAEAKSTSTAS